LLRLKQESNQGLRIHAPGVSVARLLGRNRLVINIEEDLAEEQVAREQVDVLRGKGRVMGPNTVEVALLDGGTQTLEADYLLIATGSRPRHPPGVPFEDQIIYDSNAILNLKRLPERMTIVGAGIIGCEYATIFASLGVQVDLFDIADAIIGWADRDLSTTLTDSMRLMGIRIHLNDTIEHYHRTANGLRLVSREGLEIECDQALISGGRSGNVEDLNLESVGLVYSNRGTIEVNEVYQTKVPSIFAAGDVIGRPALSATSMYQGMYVSRHLFLDEKPEYSAADMPVGIWTVPEVATIGPSEEELKERGVAYGVGRSSFLENTRAQITGETRGILKLVFELESRKLLGVHIVSDKATELLSVGQAVVHLGGTVDYFINHIFNYPTLSGVYKSAALNAIETHYGNNVAAL
jgi:NAD(P) transhydrogenase